MLSQVRPRRYGPLARFYDVLSGERLVYRAGRLAAIDLLHLEPGDEVLDIGCGTGLNLPALENDVGPSGGVVGVDASAEMLRGARERVTRAGWRNVRLVDGDAASTELGGPFDAVVFAYSLSIVSDWSTAWVHAVSATRPGGRIAVLDTAWPVGRWRLLAPLAALAFAVGGVHPARRVWDLVTRDLVDVDTRTLRGGHVRLAVGTVPAGRLSE